MRISMPADRPNQLRGAKNARMLAYILPFN